MPLRAASVSARITAALGLGVFVALGGARSSRAEPPGDYAPVPSLGAEVKCDQVPGPGKVLCTVRERPIGGRFSWGDVIVLSAPAFAPPLRTRVAAADASRSDAEGADFALALAARDDGVGELRVLARAVVCGAAGCRPVRAEAVTKVVVGGTR